MDGPKFLAYALGKNKLPLIKMGKKKPARRVGLRLQCSVNGKLGMPPLLTRETAFSGSDSCPADLSPSRAEIEALWEFLPRY